MQKPTAVQCVGTAGSAYLIVAEKLPVAVISFV